MGQTDTHTRADNQTVALRFLPRRRSEQQVATVIAMTGRIAAAAQQWRNDGVTAASSDGGPTGGRGPLTVLFYFKSEGRGPDLRK